MPAMNKPISVQAVSPGCIQLQGELTFDTVNEFLQRSKSLLIERSITFDLQQITRSDSAGLSLLIALMRYSKHQGRDIRFINLPKKLLMIAKVSGVEQLLLSRV